MTEYEKLNALIAEAYSLIQQRVTSSSPDFYAWKSKVNRFLIAKFGETSYEYDEFNKISFTLTVFPLNVTNEQKADKCREGIKKAIAILLTYLDEIRENDSEKGNDKLREADFSSVFSVYGHNEALKQAVARLIENQGIKAILLDEQTDGGKTIIEKFESNSNVGAAICLFTADDIGYEKNDENNRKPRARQNVVFETGFFIGKLGRDHIIIICDSQLELPSDMSGIVYTDSDQWQTNVLQELSSIGYKIDFNRQFKR